MLKLIIATPLYPPEIGGPATFTKLVEEEMPKKGVDVVVIKFSDVRKYPPLVRHFVFFLRILHEAKKGGLVLALDPLGIGMPAYFASRLVGRPFFVRIVGDRAWETFQQKNKDEFVGLEEFQNRKYGLGIELRRKTQRFVAVRAKRVIVPSKYLKNIVGMWGVNPDNIEVVYNSFELPAFVSSREQARLSLNISGRVILSSGRLVQWKGMQTLIEIMPDIIKEFPDVKLYIAGDGPEKEHLVSRISYFEMEKKVILLGRLSQIQLYNYINAGDVFVLNTGYEGLSHQLLEVMAAGIPIVTTLVGGNSELIENGKTGLMVDYNNGEQLKDAIIRVLSDTNLADELSAGSLERAKDFNREAILQKLVAILK